MAISETIRNKISADNLINSAVDKGTCIPMEYHTLSRGPDKEIWIRSFENDLDRLAQGFDTQVPTGTNTIFCIDPSKIPADKNVTYGQLVATI